MKKMFGKLALLATTASVSFNNVSCSPVSQNQLTNRLGPTAVSATASPYGQAAAASTNVQTPIGPTAIQGFLTPNGPVLNLQGLFGNAGVPFSPYVGGFSNFGGARSVLEIDPRRGTLVERHLPQF